ncbi:MAG TPA: putative baseplate assembly protein [Thermoanaerobaculia bacterium]|nr:putative baseplate assembly protein [Thermoanaerobaculia bacterium]
MGPYVCRDEERRAVLPQGLNGIDFVEVVDDRELVGTPFEPWRQLLLGVRLFRPAPGLTVANVEISGGVRTPVRVVQAWPYPQMPAGAERTLIGVYFADEPLDDTLFVVATDSIGDFSPYQLRLVAKPGDSEPPGGFDLRLSTVEFSFKVECPSDFDCKTASTCTPAVTDAPEISYLAKDYASFRRLMLDRMSAIAPGWRERSPADVGIALVELLAYTGDQLSYFQDAVATEAYLGTARRRVSVKRHARLVGYSLHEGVNARAWVCLRVGPAADGQTLPAGLRMLTRWGGGDTLVAPADLERAVDAGAVVFETLECVKLHSGQNEIAFYTWSDSECCLPAGATTATLVQPPAELRPNQPLLFEEVLGPQTGAAADADPRHRHVVRLTGCTPRTDPVTQRQVVDVVWDAADALPFALCISAVTDDAHGALPIDGVSVARGNLVLADHGFTVAGEDLGAVPETGPFRPRLERGPLTHAAPLPAGFDAAPAAVVRRYTPQEAAPAVFLLAGEERWGPRGDLLASGRFDPDFVAEVEEDGRAVLRFGDDENGRAPAAETAFTATYRVGNGPAGNVGAEALRQVALDALTLAATMSPVAAARFLADGIERVRNPLPAWGGLPAQSLEEARQYAPQAFRRQERAVTEADYGEVAERHPEVQRAVATFRWTGSWNTVFLNVDRLGGGPVDAAFKARILTHMERYRMAGYDLEIEGPIFVPLVLELHVCVLPDSFRSHVKAALLERFGTGLLPDGRKAFFHPDAWTFGQPVYLSAIYAAASEVQGVQSVDVVTFERWGRPAGTEIADGILRLERLEIARLDNDPNFQENGRLLLSLGGGK